MSRNISVPNGNVRAVGYYVICTDARCMACAASTRVLALAFPAGHELLDESGEEWQAVDAIVFLSCVEELPDAARDRLRQFSPGYRPSRSAASPGAPWSNHCQHCGSLQDEEALHGEPDVAFVPSGDERAAAIELHRIDEPIEVCAHVQAPVPEFLSAMRFT